MGSRATVKVKYELANDQQQHRSKHHDARKSFGNDYSNASKCLIAISYQQANLKRDCNNGRWANWFGENCSYQELPDEHNRSNETVNSSVDDIQR